MDSDRGKGSGAGNKDGEDGELPDWGTNQEAATQAGGEHGGHEEPMDSDSEEGGRVGRKAAATSVRT